MIWMSVLMIQVFFFHPENVIRITGNILFLSGIMLGFVSLSDNSKMSKKEMASLSNHKFVKRQLIFLFTGVVLLILISLLFFSIRFLFPVADKLVVSDFTKLGYDCLVMLLGFLCLIKQLIEQADYVRNQNNQ
jgi:hypothetical protein